MAERDETDMSRLRSGRREGIRAPNFTGTRSESEGDSVPRFGLLLHIVKTNDESLPKDLWNAIIIREVIAARLGEAPSRVGRLSEQEAVLLFALSEEAQGVTHGEAKDMQASLSDMREWINTPVSIGAQVITQDRAEQAYANRPQGSAGFPHPHSGGETDHSTNHPKKRTQKKKRVHKRRRSAESEHHRGERDRGDHPGSHHSTSESAFTTMSEGETDSTIRSSASSRSHRTRSRSPRPRTGGKNSTPYLPRFFGDPAKDDIQYPHWRAKLLALKPRYSEEAIKDSLNRNLRGKAMNAFMGIKDTCTDFSKELLEELDVTYGVVPDYEPPFTALSRARQKTGEDVATFGARVRDMVTNLRNQFPSAKYPERAPQNASLDRVALDRLYKGLKKSIRDAVRPNIKSTTPPSYKELIWLARSIENDEKDTWTPDIRKGPKTYTKVTSKMATVPEERQLSDQSDPETPPPSASESDPERDPDNNLEVVAVQVAQLMQKMGMKSAGNKLPMDQVVCYNCEGKGHFASACASAKKPHSKNESRGKARDTRTPEQKTKSQPKAAEASTKTAQKAPEAAPKQVTLAPKSQ